MSNMYTSLFQASIIIMRCACEVKAFTLQACRLTEEENKETRISGSNMIKQYVILLSFIVILCIMELELPQVTCLWDYQSPPKDHSPWQQPFSGTSNSHLVIDWYRLVTVSQPFWHLLERPTVSRLNNHRKIGK